MEGVLLEGGRLYFRPSRRGSDAYKAVLRHYFVVKCLHIHFVRITITGMFDCYLLHLDECVVM